MCLLQCRLHVAGIATARTEWRIQSWLLFHGLLRSRRRPGVPSRRRLPGEASRRSSDTRIGAGSADHSNGTASSPACRARDSKAAGATVLTATSEAAADRRIRRTRPSAVRRRRITSWVGVGCRSRRTRPSAVRRCRIFDIHPPPPWVLTTYGTVVGRRPRRLAQCSQVSKELRTARSARSGAGRRHSRSCRHSRPALRPFPFASL